MNHNSLSFCRAKALKDGSTVYGYYVKHVFGDTTSRPKERGYLGYLGDGGPTFVEVDPATVQRHVGMDENRDDLYEGDEVEVYRYEKGERVSHEVNCIRYDGFGFMPMARWSHVNTTNEYRFVKIKR